MATNSRKGNANKRTSNNSKRTSKRFQASSRLDANTSGIDSGESFSSNAESRSNNDARFQRRSRNCKNTAKSYKGQKPHVIMPGSGAPNDPQWYTHIINTSNYLGDFSFNTPVGSPLQLTYDTQFVAEDVFGNGAFNKVQKHNLNLPGILRYTVGLTFGQGSALDLAADQLYAKVRQANSGAVNYDKTDLMMVLLAMDSIYALYEHVLRIVRVATTFSTDNYYLPDALLSALGVPRDCDVLDDLPRLQAFLDIMVYQLGSINMPAMFDLFKRHSWLFTNVFKDSETLRDQLYVLVPQGVFILEDHTETGTSLGYREVANFYRQVANDEVGADYTVRPRPANPSIYLNADTGRASRKYSFYDVVRFAYNTMYSRIRGSELIGVVSGDIAKAFNDSDLIKLQPYSRDEAFEPVYDLEALHQIMNATVLNVTRQQHPTMSNPSSPGETQHYTGSDTLVSLEYGSHAWYTDLRQKVTDVSSGPVFISTVDFATRNDLVNINWASSRNVLVNFQDGFTPTPENMMAATRFISYPENGAILSGTQIDAYKSVFPFAWEKGSSAIPNDNPGGNSYYSGWHSLESYGTEVVIEAALYTIRHDFNGYSTNDDWLTAYDIEQDVVSPETMIDTILQGYIKLVSDNTAGYTKDILTQGDSLFAKFLKLWKSIAEHQLRGSAQLTSFEFAPIIYNWTMMTYPSLAWGEWDASILNKDTTWQLRTVSANTELYRVLSKQSVHDLNEIAVLSELSPLL